MYFIIATNNLPRYKDVNNAQASYHTVYHMGIKAPWGVLAVFDTPFGVLSLLLFTLGTICITWYEVFTVSQGT